MLLDSLRALFLAPGVSGSIKKYLEALVRLPRVSGRIACCFRTDLHLAEEAVGTSKLDLWSASNAANNQRFYVRSG